MPSRMASFGHAEPGGSRHWPVGCATEPARSTVMPVEFRSRCDENDRINRHAKHSRPAGQPISDTRCRATIVRRGASWRSDVEVFVYKDHLTVREPGVGRWTIYGTEIRSVTHQSGPLRRMALAIEHAVSDFGSSVALTIELDHPVRKAIVEIRRDVPRPARMPFLEPAPLLPGAFNLGPANYWRLRRAWRASSR